MTRKNTIVERMAKKGYHRKHVGTREKIVIAKMVVEGKPKTEIKRITGRGDVTLNKILKSSEIRELIEVEAGRLINLGLRPACDNILGLVEDSMTEEGRSDKDLRKLGFDASKHITSMAGLSGNAPGTVINTLIQVNQMPERKEELNNIQKFLQHQWGISETVQDEAIDSGEADNG